MIVMNDEIPVAVVHGVIHSDNRDNTAVHDADVHNHDARLVSVGIDLRLLLLLLPLLLSLSFSLSFPLSLLFMLSIPFSLSLCR